MLNPIRRLENRFGFAATFAAVGPSRSAQTIALTGLAMAAAISACGAPIENFDFSLRFPAAISRFASYADVAGMGNAQAASIWSSSNNPAAAAWPHAGRPYPHSFSPQGSALRFDAGNHLYVTSESVTLDAGKYGSFTPAIAQISSNHKSDRTGTGFEFEGDLYQLSWGKLVTPDTAVGANFNATFSDLHQDIPGFFDAKNHGKSYDFRVGILHKLDPEVRVGVVIDYTRAPGRADVTAFNPLLGAFQSFRVEDTTNQLVFRTGVAWEYSEGSTFMVDYQGGIFHNDTGRLRVNRFPIGIEHCLIQHVLFLRAGVTLDTRGETAFTTGVGLSLGKRATVDVSYQHDMFPEISPEFGSSKAFTLSVGIAF